MDANAPWDEASLLASDEPAREPAWLVKAVWALVAIGIAARLLRYALRFPLWGDESFVAANFLDRGFADLAKPLDYHQVCPLGFLWIERAVVDVLGFNEYALRLAPLVAGIAAVVLFVRVAHLAVRGWAWALAVGILAVGYYPLRHSVEVKPYSSDLLWAVLLLWPALRAWRAPGEARWWWWLTALAAPAIFCSHPAVFVAGGISLALGLSVWRSRSRGAWIAFGAYNLSIAAVFVAVYVLFTSAQYSTEFTAGGMSESWKDAFPPWREPLRMAAWLVETHTGHMLAYPVGGKRGGSVLSAIACAAALAWLARRGETRLIALLVAPFLLALAAATMERYPYGGSQRTMQYTAPLIGLMVGLGGAVLLAMVKSEATRSRLRTGSLVGLGLLAVAAMARDIRKPYKTAYDEASRQFVRKLISETPPGARLACVHRDLGRELAPGCFEWEHSARYQCNLAIYGGMRPEPVEGPLRCVVYSVPHFPVSEAARSQWLAEMDSRYALVDRRVVELHADSPTHHEWYEVYDFAPARTARGR